LAFAFWTSTSFMYPARSIRFSFLHSPMKPGTPAMSPASFAPRFTRRSQYGKPLAATVARVRQISQVPIYVQEGMNRLNQVRFQIDVLASDIDTVDQATAAVSAWLGTVNLASDDQFQSPPVTPLQFPSFVLNVRPGLEVQLKPPVPVNSIDVKVFNLDLI